MDFDIELDRVKVRLEGIAAFADGNDQGQFFPILLCVHALQILRKIRLVDTNRFCEVIVDGIPIDKLDFKFLDGIAVIVELGLGLFLIPFGFGETETLCRNIIGLGIKGGGHLLLQWGFGLLLQRSGAQGYQCGLPATRIRTL